MKLNYEYTQLGYMAPTMAGETPEMDGTKFFNKEYNHGRFGQILARLLNRENHLLVLDTLAGPSRRTPDRIVSVPIRKIKGSLSRGEDFDASFHPLKETSRTRWVSIYTAIRSDIPLPAVELVQVGNTYYVRDGHHRISVAHSLDQEAIDAHIVN